MKPAFASSDKPWVGVDLDGTLAEHYWPQRGEFHPLIIGKPIAPMVDEVKRILADGYTVRIFTARVGVRGPSGNNKGVKLAQIKQVIFDWTKEHVGVGLEATCVKDYNMISLYDDRAVRIMHNKGVTCCSFPQQ